MMQATTPLQATSALNTCRPSHLSCPHSKSNHRLTPVNLVSTNGLIVLLGYWALNNVLWLCGLAGCVPRAWLVLVILTGFVLHYVPETRTPTKIGCLFMIDLVAFGLKNFLDGIDYLDQEAKTRNYDSVSLNSNATENIFPINFSSEMKCNSIFGEQKSHDDRSIFPDNTSQSQRQECRWDPSQLYEYRNETRELVNGKMHQSSNSKFKEKSSDEIIPTLSMPLMQSETSEHQEFSIFSRTHCDQCASRQEDLIGNDVNEGSDGKTIPCIDYRKDIENSCHSSEIQLVEWNESDFGGNQDIADSHNGYRRSTATSCSCAGSINSRLHQPLEIKSSVAIVPKDPELVLEKTKKMDETRHSVVPMEQEENLVLRRIRGQKSTKENLKEKKLCCCKIGNCCETENCCKMKTDLETTDNGSITSNTCCKAKKTGYFATFFQTLCWIFGTYPTVGDLQVPREKKISTFVKANLKDFI